MATIVTAEREDLPAHGLPPSLLSDLMDQIRCGAVTFEGNDVYRPQEIKYELQLCLPEMPGPSRGPGRTVRLYFFRLSGPDFAERDRALLTLVRPHLHAAYLDAERRRAPGPGLTPRQRDLLRLVADGHTNTQQAARLQPHLRGPARLPRPGGIGPRRAARPGPGKK